MPAIPKATMNLIVSFNCSFGDYDCGEADRYSEDFEGNDVDKLAAEVCNSDPNYPMTFKRNKGDGGSNDPIIGMFYGEDDEYPDALMIDAKYF
jgi:hypothetical protein